VPETSEQTLHRQQQDGKRKASTRANETSEQSVHRKQQDRKHKASMRANETSEQSVHRKQQDRKHKASMRANETSEQSVHRKQQDRKCRTWSLSMRIPTCNHGVVALHAEGLKLQCLSFLRIQSNSVFIYLHGSIVLTQRFTLIT
jgi:hypothetical protein